MSHLRPLIGGGAENGPPATAAFSAGESETSRQNMPGDCSRVAGFSPSVEAAGSHGPALTLC